MDTAYDLLDTFGVALLRALNFLAFVACGAVCLATAYAWNHGRINQETHWRLVSIFGYGMIGSIFIETCLSAWVRRQVRRGFPVQLKDEQ